MTASGSESFGGEALGESWPDVAFLLHCGPTAEGMPPAYLESTKAMQVREQGLTKAFKCMVLLIAKGLCLAWQG